MTMEQNEQMALEIIEYLQEHELFSDVNMYLNGKRYSSDQRFSDRTVKTAHGEYYVTDDIDVNDYVEYNNPDTITMTFEGPLYAELNYGNGPAIDALNDIAAKYGLYYEQGHAWNLAFYEG